jgi:integrase
VPDSVRGKLDPVRKTAHLVRWPKKGLRHSFASYRLAAIHDAPRVASELGHTTPQLLYNTYRELVRAGRSGALLEDCASGGGEKRSRVR